MTPDMMMPEEEMKKNWGWLLALGISLLVLGLIAITMALASTLATVVFLGFLLLIAGGFEISNAFRQKHEGGFAMHLFTGILDVVCGALLIAFPMVGAAGITLILAILLLVGGPVRAFSAIYSNMPNRSWAIVSGLIDFALGMVLLFSWPQSALWLLGTIVGVALVFRGAWWASYAFALRRKGLPQERHDGYPDAHGDHDMGHGAKA